MVLSSQINMQCFKNSPESREQKYLNMEWNVLMIGSQVLKQYTLPLAIISKLYAWSFKTMNIMGNSKIHFPERFSANDSVVSNSKNFLLELLNLSAVI